MEIKKDILGRTPEVGDVIGFNPARYKGIILRECKGFSKAGLPEVETGENYIGQRNDSGYYTPKTDFIIIKDILDGNTCKELQ